MEDQVNITMPNVDATQIVVKDLTYIVTRSLKRGSKKVTEDKVILDHVNVVFKPGRLSVIIGPSGSGKTSLLSLIAGVAQNIDAATKVKGKILFNGTEMAPQEVRKLIGFVFQDDVLLPTMTVQESIYMSVVLRMPQMNAVERLKIVNRMLDVSQLKHVANTKIGDSLKKGISGGERKRTAISMELVSNPSVLLLDEPTSGLDSYTAFRNVALLKRLAHMHGRTVVATLHQPSSELFFMIDDLYVMLDGKIAYAGPASTVVEYFDRLGYKFSQWANPADTVMMGVLNRYQEDEFYEDTITDTSGTFGDSQRVNKMTLVTYENVADASNLPGVYHDSILFKEDQLSYITQPVDTGVHRGMFRYKATFLTSFRYLLTRDLKNARRNPMIIRTKLFQTLFLASFIALIFQNAADAPIPAVYQNLSGVIYFLIINAFFASFNNTLTVFGHEKAIFFREYSQGYYGLTPYYIAKISVELPLTLSFPILTSLITYWVVGLRPGLIHWIVFTVSLMMVSLAGFSFAMLVACIFNDVNVALALSIMIILPMMIMAGLFINVDTTPVYLSWLQWISPLKYAYTASLIDQFKGKGSGYDVFLANSGVENGLGIVMNWVIVVVISVVCLMLAYLALFRHVLPKGGLKNVLTRTKSV